MKQLFLFPLVISLNICLNGCSLFFGNIKPVEEKSTQYQILDISENSAQWKRLEPHPDSKGSESSPPTDLAQTSIADTAYQSNYTGSIISISSACRSYENDRKEDLKALTHELLLGISEINLFAEKNIQIDHSPGLETTLQGKINQETMKLRTVVIQNANCVYDLMYISRPDKFNIEENEFSRFVSSLKLK